MKKITDPIELYKLREEGISVKDICERYNISRGSYQVALRKACEILGVKLVKNTTLGQKRTEKQKVQMRKPKSKKHCENISKGRKGYKPRQESINKWKESMVKTGYAHLKTKEYRKKLSCIMSGKKKSEAHCRKMSEIMKGKSYNNYKRGYYNSEKSGKIFYRSSLELKAYIILDKDINISSFKPEPFSVDYVFEGYDRKYRPDLLITKTNGSKVLAEVKPHQEVKWLVNKAKFEGARKVCKDSGMNFKIMTDKYLDSIIGKQGELLETLSSILNKDNQQPSTSNESRSIVDVKVQRLIGENDSLNKPDKSALHPIGHIG